MNERIKELAEQAGFDPRWSTKADREALFDIQVFAELIVKEAAQVAWRHDIGRMSRRGAEVGLAIELHFGVD